MPYSPIPELTIDSDGPVRVVTLNRPEAHNSLNDAMHVAMQEIWWHLSDDDDVRAVVLTGSGKSFCAGGDLASLQQFSESIDRRRRAMRGARRLIDAMAEFPKPLVAAINGGCTGMGSSIALGCDLVLMGESAYISDPHVPLGIVGGDGGPALWPLLMGLLKAKELLLLGERIPAQEAVSVGLANRVVPDDELMSDALALAHRLAALPRQSVQETKRALNLHVQQAIALVAPFALAAESESFVTDEVISMIEAFNAR
jgi:enoyl-CoA hydratase